MRNVLKAETLERKFPLLAVEHGCIVSKDADLTVAFEVLLPEIYTVTGDEYEAIHSAWVKAIRVLPDYSVVCKQDWFVEETYRPDFDRDGQSFLAKSYERHFNERLYLGHRCYLYLTKTTRERSRHRSDFSTLCRGHILPREIADRDTAARFLEAVEQFERIMNDSGKVSLRRMPRRKSPARPNVRDWWRGISPSRRTTGLRYWKTSVWNPAGCASATSSSACIPCRPPTTCPAGWKRTCVTDGSPPTAVTAACRLPLPWACSFPATTSIRSTSSLMTRGRYCRIWRSPRATCSPSPGTAAATPSTVNGWKCTLTRPTHKACFRCAATATCLPGPRMPGGLRRVRNDTGSQLAMMECTPRHNTVDTPVLYWAGIPGNAGDFPAEESFHTFLEQAVCLFTEETNYRSSPSPFGIRLTDRRNGIPVHVDISDEPMRRGIITNRNKFILGPSGSGKSFFTNHLVRNYYEQGAHVLLVDTGNSYRGLCSLVNGRTHGGDGIYITYEEDNPIAFNPFHTASGEFDVEKRESIKTLILTLWKREDEAPKRSEEVALSGAVNAYIRRITEDLTLRPDFNGFYEFVRDDYRRIMEEKKVREKDFDIDGFLNVLEPFYKGGDYDFLLNSDKGLDLTDKRFIVFELDNISSHKVLLPVVTLIIMETFIAKMRRLKGIRKVMLIEECWKALMSANMSAYVLYLFKTVRKYFGEAIVVTQEVDDIVSSPIVKEAIINNSDCKILLDQRKYMNKFDHIQTLLGLTEKEKGQILSINQANRPGAPYREVWIGLGGTHSAVYATEVSEEEYLVFTTEETEKMEVQRLAEELGGNLELAVRRLAGERGEKRKQSMNP